MVARYRIVAAGALTAVAVGCSSTSQHGSTTAEPPALGQIQTITDPTQIVLPTDPYMVTSAQIKQVTQAQDAVTADCMRDFGFTAKPTTVLGADTAAMARLTRSRLYGYFDVAKAKTLGYDRFAQTDQVNQDAAQAPPASVAEQTALSGNDPTTRQPVTTLNGKPLPPGGCFQKGRDALKDDSLLIDDSALPEGGPKIPVNDPRIVEAYATWSQCMKSKGFDYKDPIGAIGDQKWKTGRPANGSTNPDEIAAATADIDCKIANNTVGVIVAVQTAYDKKYIEANAAKLTAYRQQTEDLVRRAAHIASGGQG
ncbi:hypothetical protein [Kitasatospora sp. NPDC088351]|uniref:hypothetical protein n=1 Tax=Kitasatospora sp. NPDC088351 TaxID=3155180 RepID=UPI003439A5AD